MGFNLLQVLAIFISGITIGISFAVIDVTRYVNKRVRAALAEETEHQKRRPGNDHS